MKVNFSKWSLPLLWFFAFAVIIFMITMTANAEENPYFPMTQNNGNITSDTGKNTINTTLNSDDYYIFTVYRDTYNSRQRYYYVKFPKNQDGKIYGEISNNGYQFSLYTVGGSGRFYIAGGLQLKSDGTLYNYTENFDNLSYFQNLVSSNYQVANSFMSNFWLYNNNTDQKIPLLTYGPDPDEPTNPVDIGVAIIPPDAFTPVYGSGDFAPTQVPPSFTINNYTWTTAPSFDNSSVINGIQSIKDTLDWFATNIQGVIANLITNIKGLAEYIGKTIQYYGNAIIQTINDGIQNFYDNMAALVQPIFEKIAYITEEVDSDEISDAINNTSFVGLKNQFNTFFTTFENAFDISEPTTFTLTINIQNIDTFYNFGCRSPVIIHLDEHFTPIKTALRTFLWILISFGSVFVVERGLSDWIRGENDTK